MREQLVVNSSTPRPASCVRSANRSGAGGYLDEDTSRPSGLRSRELGSATLWGSRPERCRPTVSELENGCYIQSWITVTGSPAEVEQRRWSPHGWESLQLFREVWQEAFTGVLLRRG